ncbi:hypothetical protein AFB00_30535 (plasmid) [Pseudonocardia sp. HH130630-07]|nr:hypothetical protein AFB00_30535 [Pseudonocardia sp. HH130630-07]
MSPQLSRYPLRLCRGPDADLACGFTIGTSTVYRYIREALDLLAAQAPTLEQAIEVAKRKAFVILDGTLLRIDRVGMASGYDRAFYSGKHKAHGLNVQVIADPVGRLVWISPPLPGARHDMGAAREHGIIDALAEHEIPAAADTAYQGAGPTVAVPQRRRRKDPDTGRFRKLSSFQKDVNKAHARRHAAATTQVHAYNRIFSNTLLEAPHQRSAFELLQRGAGGRATDGESAGRWRTPPAPGCRAGPRRARPPARLRSSGTCLPSQLRRCRPVLSGQPRGGRYRGTCR